MSNSKSGLNQPALNTGGATAMEDAVANMAGTAAPVKNANGQENQNSPVANAPQTIGLGFTSGPKNCGVAAPQTIGSGFTSGPKNCGVAAPQKKETLADSCTYFGLNHTFIIHDSGADNMSALLLEMASALLTSGYEALEMKSKAVVLQKNDEQIALYRFKDFIYLAIPSVKVSNDRAAEFERVLGRFKDVNTVIEPVSKRHGN